MMSTNLSDTTEPSDLEKLINKQKLTDAHTCYKLFRVKLFKKLKLKENDFAFCPEVTTKLSNRKIKILENNQEKVIEVIDDVGLFTREIDEASSCIKAGKIESTFMSHADSLSNSIWLDKWLNELGVDYPANSINTSSLKSSVFSKPSKDLNSIKIPELDKEISPIVFGCDNQINEVHAFAMFDYYYSKGGKVFDTAYIYNHGLSDKYLGDWINSRNLTDVDV